MKKVLKDLLRKSVWPFFGPFLRPLKKKVDLYFYKKTGIHNRTLLLVSDDKSFVYVVNPKCACSSLKLACIGRETQSLDYHHIHDMTKRQEYSRTELSRKQREYYKFTFVRNPFARIVSFYVSKYEDYNGRSGGYVNKVMSDSYSQVNTFDDLVDTLIQTEFFCTDMHLMPQYSILDSAGGNIDFIGRLETLAADYQHIEKMFELPKITHQNKSPKYNYMDYYSLDTLEKVADYYKEDIIRYGYSDTYEQIKKYLLNR